VRRYVEVNKSLEAARNDKLIGASLQAKAVVYAADADFAAQLESRKVGRPTSLFVECMYRDCRATGESLVP